MIDFDYYRLLSINYVWHNTVCVLYMNMQSSLENMKTQLIRGIQNFLFFFVFTEYNNTVR